MKNNKSEYLIKLLDFIECDFDTFSDDVKAQAKKMFLDLAGVICAGAKNNTAQTIAAYVKEIIQTENIQCWDREIKLTL